MYFFILFWQSYAQQFIYYFTPSKGSDSIPYMAKVYLILHCRSQVSPYCDLVSDLSSTFDHCMAFACAHVAIPALINARHQWSIPLGGCYRNIQVFQD